MYLDSPDIEMAQLDYNRNIFLGSLENNEHVCTTLIW